MEVCGYFCNLRIFVCDGGTVLIDISQMLFGVRSAKLPVTTGSNGVLFDSNFFYNKQLCCANIEPSGEQVLMCVNVRP